MSPTTKALVEKLTPIAKAQGTKLDADDLRYHAEGSNINLNTEKPSVVSAAITGALRAAGYTPTSQTITSLNPSAKGRRVVVWTKYAEAL